MKHAELVPLLAFFVVGFLFGATTAIVGATGLSGDDAASWLFKWQTLVASGFATAAASLTVGILVWQTRAQARQAETQRQRQLVAARATLPAELFVMGEHARHLAFVLRRIDEGLAQEEPTVEVPHVKDLPERTLRLLRDVIAVADAVDAQKIADLLNWYQIAITRVTGDRECFRRPEQNRSRPLGRDGLRSAANSIAEYYLRIIVMFRFARGESNHIPPNSSALGSFNAMMQDLRLDTSLSPRVRVAMQEAFLDLVDRQ